MKVEASDGTSLRTNEIHGAGVPVVLSHSLASSARELAPMPRRVQFPRCERGRDLEVSGAGHMVPIENPATIADAALG